MVTANKSAAKPGSGTGEKNLEERSASEEWVETKTKMYVCAAIVNPVVLGKAARPRKASR
jgi:hypothetical protein